MILSFDRHCKWCAQSALDFKMLAGAENGATMSLADDIKQLLECSICRERCVSYFCPPKGA